MIPVAWYLILSGLLFTIGLTGVLIRRNILIIFMCVELMMNAVNISLVAFARSFADKKVHFAGDSFMVFVITVAAAEAAVGLAIIISLSRQQNSVDADDIDLLKE